MKVVYIEYQVQTKEWGNIELEDIVPYSLGDGVRSISEWENIAMGSNEVLLMQMQPHFFTHLEIVWHPMLIMQLLVLSIGSVQYVMDLLTDMLNMLNEFFFPVRFGPDIEAGIPTPLEKGCGR